MARKPISLQQDTIPFTEGAPPDDLLVEEIGDDVLIGDPALDDVSEKDDQFHKFFAVDKTQRERFPIKKRIDSKCFCCI